MKALSFIAGLGEGYMGGEEKKKDRARQDAKDKQASDLFDMQMAEYKQRQTDRDDLKTAGANVAVTPDQGPPTEAMQATRDPLAPVQPAIGYTAGSGKAAKSFATEGVALQDAATRNAPGARAGRIAELAAQGNTLAATVQSQGITNQLGKIQVTEAEQNFADKAIRKSIMGLKTFQDIGKYISDSPADNQGGQFKGDFVLGKDGTQEFYRTNIDGTKEATGMKFKNDDAGMEKARLTLAGAMTPEQRIQQSQFEQQIKITQQNADTSRFTAESADGARKDAARHQRVMEGISATKASGKEKASDGVDMSTIDKTLTSLFTKDDPNSGVKSLDTNGLMLVRSLATRMPAAFNGDSNGAALQAYNAYAAALTKAGGDHGAAVQLLNAAMSPAPAKPAATVPPVIPSQEANIKKHAAPLPVVTKEAPAGGYVKPAHYVGIEKVAPRRGSPGGYSYQGKQYATEQEALAAYESSKAQILATKQGMR